jgi:hypothetical protein
MGNSFTIDKILYPNLAYLVDHWGLTGGIYRNKITGKRTFKGSFNNENPHSGCMFAYDGETMEEMLKKAEEDLRPTAELLSVVQSRIQDENA